MGRAFAAFRQLQARPGICSRIGDSSITSHKEFANSLILGRLGQDYLHVIGSGNSFHTDDEKDNTMKTVAFIAVALALSAGAVSASSVNPGKAQIAAQLGVDATEYTSTELQLIAKARKDKEPLAEQFYLSHTNRTVQSGDVGVVTLGKAQVAAQLGLDPAAYTSAELSLISSARERNDVRAEAFYVNHENRVEGAAAGTVTPGQAQLAASLGVNPADYTLAELAVLKARESVANR